MRDVGNKLVFGLVILFMVISIVMPSVIYFRYSDVVKPSQSYSVATVSLTVSLGVCGDDVCDGNETCSNCPGDCGACPPADTGTGGGGGGGGGAGPAYETHLLDFTKNIEYVIDPKRGDKIKTIFERGLEYNFDVTGFVAGSELLLGYKTESYEIGYYEIAYFDLDGDGMNDMSVNFADRTNVKFRALYFPTEEPGEEVLPMMSKEKIKYPVFVPGTGVGLNLLFILVLVAIAILIIFTYHHLKLRRLEKTQRKKIVKIYHTYKRSKKSKEDKIKMKEKLIKQKSLLQKAYKSGYVSKESYLKGSRRINNLVRKL